ncbi:Endo-chitosanase [Colletotrichum siamense]|uniref:Endo-chitosanase n=1 Tax=Colletotrichum siamense TaxID=690259 RepID=A0A9P5F5Z8_COLSI|nr:Endo-chitosanase [Colletotrichum siamense]KAF4867182.1 Endo-chitosanase [Colletotrichum siamense]
MILRVGFFFQFLVTLVPIISALDVPENVKDFYDHVRGKGKCGNVLKGGFNSMDGDSGDFGYCGDYLEKYNIIYIQGKKGQLTNMDIDCDGAQTSGDGRCASSTDTQSQTTFKSRLSSWGNGDLNSYIHPYVVFGNEGSKPNWPNFDPKEYGVEPLSVMAIVCNNQLFYGVWGDTNGDDGDQPMVGEASIALATSCFGNGVNGNQGHDENDVLYIAFTGQDAAPGANGANWSASTSAEFSSSIDQLGNRLVERVGSGANLNARADKAVLFSAYLLGLFWIIS